MRRVMVFKRERGRKREISRSSRKVMVLKRERACIWKRWERVHIRKWGSCRLTMKQNYPLTITAHCSQIFLQLGRGCWKDCTVLWLGYSPPDYTSGLWGNRKNISWSSHLSPSRYCPPVQTSSIFCSMQCYHHLRCSCHYDFTGCMSVNCQQQESKYDSTSCADGSASLIDFSW